MNALMTNVNNPRVRISSGNVKSFRIGRTLALSTPNTSATTNNDAADPP